MPRHPLTHPYSDRCAFERLMMLIATLVQYPGVGSADSLETKIDGHHEALAAVQVKVRELAQDLNIDLPEYSIPTLRKDLVALRQYGILDKRMYRWGYYLGTGVMSKPELQVAMNALASLAQYQGLPQAKRIYAALEQRLRGLDWQSDLDFFYPVRSQIDRAIILTDPEEMMAKQRNRHNLFNNLDTVESAILEAKAIEIYRKSNPYDGKIGYLRVFPLQLLYHDIAWYLLYEYCDRDCFEIERIDRFKDSCRFISNVSRSLDTQRERLKLAHKLIDNGWGLHLGNEDEQKLEHSGELSLVRAKVRFFPPAMRFIEEGELRHPKQKIDLRGKPKYIDYTIDLPPRSLPEFSRWIDRYMDGALVIAPQELVESHKQTVLRLIELYSYSQ
ncbi:helix-turn-helix transcriptional regulator [Pseudanabaena sp. PCC 6802]|uniref:helix-turn-helix transcriptional regulator n=1 Tax=Pseudanabaena sp. PCC 6802 TaxID=118173 RepID=UPI0004781594|nr:WYL domain-containing protein [Pseudanabaena sp. PCC 6802]